MSPSHSPEVLLLASCFLTHWSSASKRGCDDSGSMCFHGLMTLPLSQSKNPYGPRISSSSPPEVSGKLLLHTTGWQHLSCGQLLVWRVGSLSVEQISLPHSLSLKQPVWQKFILFMIWSSLEWTDYEVYCLKTTHIWLCYNLPGVHFGTWHTPLESQNCVPPVTSLHEIISCLDSEPSIRVPSGQANVTDCPGVYSVPWWWQFLTQTPGITVCQKTFNVPKNHQIETNKTYRLSTWRSLDDSPHLSNTPSDSREEERLNSF